MTFDEFLDILPDEFSFAGLREKAKMLGIKVPTGLQEVLYDKGYALNKGSNWRKIKGTRSFNSPISRRSL